jgi:spore coat polysaccharide biosynthesis protein SpsF
MVLFLLKRLQPLKDGKLVLATTDLESDNELAAIAEAEGFAVYRGDGSDVVARYVDAARHFDLDTVVRVTGDCPFIDAALVEWCIARASQGGHFDLATTKGNFPVGLDAEIYHAGRMAQLCSERDLSPSDREHLTLYFYNHRDEFVVRGISPPPGWLSTKQRFTVDTPDDYAVAQKLASSFDRFDFSLDALLTKAAA